MEFFMNMAQKKKKLGWKLNKEQKSVHAVKSYLHSHQKYDLKNHGKIYGRRK